MSGIGKGVTCSSIGTILSSHNYKVNMMKIDPYLNVDAGNMNPTEHGEVFVLRSGLECDQDMGNYERFIGRDLSQDDYLTSGMVYKSVIERERSFGYSGKCVEAIPDVTNEIQDRIIKSAELSKADIQIVEIGGTVGDYQSSLYFEAAKRMRRIDKDKVKFVFITYFAVPPSIGEIKTRPTQHAIQLLNSHGINLDILIARSVNGVDKKHKDKIVRACDLKNDCVISAPDVDSIYDIPILFEKDGLGKKLLSDMGLKSKNNVTSMKKWSDFSKKVKNGKKKVKIAIAGKYFSTGEYILSDSYVSVIEAIKFSAVENNVGTEIDLLDSNYFSDGNTKKMKELLKYDGIIIPGGYGTRGIMGKYNIISFVRKNKIPFLGICYGMQLAFIEFLRNVCKISSIDHEEINPKAKEKGIILMNEQKDKLMNNDYGGSMRLGEYHSVLKKGSLVHKMYGKTDIRERHRHRYEVNKDYIDIVSKNNLHISGLSKKGGLVETIEIDKKIHPFFVGSQYHPEFTARPFSPNPMFSGFINASKKKMQKR